MSGGWNYDLEYAHKINDPRNSLSPENMNYASGNGFIQNITYPKEDLGYQLKFIELTI